MEENRRLKEIEMSEDYSCYGPLESLIGSWGNGSENKGENRAPAPDRSVENTKFRQEIHFEPAGDFKNHEQLLYGLNYKTTAWEEGDDEPFHEEVGYWLWDAKNKQVMKCFIVPRGISLIAGATAEADASSFELVADLGSSTYGICSNKFLDAEFKTVKYVLAINKIDKNTFSYDEDSHLQIKGQDEIFHHTEKNTMKRL